MASVVRPLRREYYVAASSPELSFRPVGDVNFKRFAIASNRSGKKLVINKICSYITLWSKSPNLSVFVLFTMLPYPMKYLCILRKYISRPLLLSQSGPCCHIGSEMYLQPSRPRMHANSASRQISRFVLQEIANSLNFSNDFYSFPR